MKQSEIKSILFYCQFMNDDKILFISKSVKGGKSFATKYAKTNNTHYLIGGHAYTLSALGENISDYKLVEKIK